jgi:hypothetical protein
VYDTADCLLKGGEAPRKSRFAFDAHIDSSVALNDDPLARSAFGGEDPLTGGSSLGDPLGGSFSGWLQILLWALAGAGFSVLPLA